MNAARIEQNNTKKSRASIITDAIIEAIQQFIKEGIGAIQALAKANSLSSENKLK